MHAQHFLVSAISLIFFVESAHAGDKKDIIVVQEALIDSWNANDVDATQQYYPSDFENF